MIVCEYLVSFEKGSTQCSTIRGVKSLLESDDSIKIENDKIIYKEDKFVFYISTEERSNDNYNIFYIKLTNEVNNSVFRELQKIFKKILNELKHSIVQVIYDGISQELNTKLYPKINSVENLLRKLITRFMFKSLGPDWYKKSVPEKVKESAKKRKPQLFENLLFVVDFIQLSNFLFTEYAHKKDKDLNRFLIKIKNTAINETIKNDIDDYIRKSNWDRYFSNIVEFESEQFLKKWKELYEIRNVVAHNKNILYVDYKKGKCLCKELTNVLQNAFDSLDKINIPELDKDEIINNYNNLYGTYLNAILKASSDIGQIIAEATKPIENIQNKIYIDTENLIEPYREFSELAKNLNHLNDEDDGATSPTNTPPS